MRPPSPDPGNAQPARRANHLAIPTLAQEDAKRPNRERESLVSEQSRIVNRMKAALARLGIRGFNPKLKTAVERLEGLCTPEDEPIPPNTLAELKRDMERCRLVRSQIRDIEKNRVERIDQAPSVAAGAGGRGCRRVWCCVQFHERCCIEILRQFRPARAAEPGNMLSLGF